MTRGTCRSCRRGIYWAKTPSGKLMPVDLGVDPDGTIVLTTQGRDVIATIDPDAPGPKHLSHFASCPQAKQWRR